MKKPQSGNRQYAALIVRPDPVGELQVLLITSRDTGRWVIPKGWPMPGRSPVEAAIIEAYEEAGVVGRPLNRRPIGVYHYRKLLRSGQETDLRVGVFLLRVQQLLDDWPERGQRTLDWFSPTEAAALVAEPALARIIRRLPRAKSADLVRR